MDSNPKEPDGATVRAILPAWLGTAATTTKRGALIFERYLPRAAVSISRSRLTFERIRPFAIFLVASATILPILVHGFPRGSDIQHHYRWSSDFFQMLARGNLYPRWLPGLNRGYGSPVPIYYPPLSFYVSALFNTVCGDTMTSIALSCWLAMLLSGMTMYRFSRKLLSGPPALLAATLFMLAPYHIFDLYRGNSIAEYWCFAWIPLLLSAIVEVCKLPGWRAVPWLAASYALLLLTNVPMSLAVTLVLPIFVLVLTRKRESLMRIGAGLSLGFGLSSVFSLAAIFERTFVTSDPLLEKSFERTFMLERIYQVVHINPFSQATYPKFEGYLLEADLVAVCVLVLAGMAAVVACKRIHRRRQMSGIGPSLFAAVLTVGGVSLFMTTRLSRFIWSSIPQLKYLQVANRWLLLATVAACLLAAFAASTLTSGTRKRILAVTLLGSAVALNIVASAHISTQEAVDHQTFADEMAHNDFVEFFPPKWWSPGWDRRFEESSYILAAGDCQVTLAQDNGIGQQYAAHAITASVLRFRPLYFPGWTARIDGKRVAIQRDEAGHVQVAIPPGDHKLDLTFEDTPLRLLGKTIALLSLAVCLGMFWRTRRRNKGAMRFPPGVGASFTATHRKTLSVEPPKRGMRI